MYRYEIERQAEEPDRDKSRAGRKKKWFLPLDDLEPGDAINLSMSAAEARDRIYAVRAHVTRESRKLGKSFSVYLSEEGVKIWRRYDD